MVDAVLSESIIGRARKAGVIEVFAHNIRDYSKDKHRRCDDTPCGGGMGMLMTVPPIYDCHSAVKQQNPQAKTVYLSPQGRVLTQKIAEEYSKESGIILLCGHYEGVDRRAVDLLCDDEISIGDYVLTGGELAACIFTDCVARLCEGVLSSPECHEKESFSCGMLEYPQYTRPIDFMGHKVPKELLSGNHEEIEKWRYQAALALTKKNRPDLL